MEGDPEVPMRLEAAEALSDLGDEDGLDLLIETLDDTEEEHDEMAAEMLDWLDLPRGNKALRERGYAFETNGANLIEAQETEPIRQVVREREARKNSWTSRVPTMPGGSGANNRPEQGASSTSLGAILTGAAGGVLGFLFVCFGLDLLGMRPLPAELQGWLEPFMVFWLIESLVIGAVAGNIGSRTVRAVATRAGEDLDEQDAPADAGRSGQRRGRRRGCGCTAVPALRPIPAARCTIQRPDHGAESPISNPAT